MEFEQLIRLINVVSDSKLKQFKYEEKGVKISMGKEIKIYSNKGMEEYSISSERNDGHTLKQPEDVSDMEVPCKIKEESTVLKETVFDKEKEIVSPLVGTFYEASQEGAEPFVTVGSQVKKGQVLAIVEAMKLMNEIESEQDGVITEICVKNGEAVEYGQTLFKIADGVL